jgi:hypothetical protein
MKKIILIFLFIFAFALIAESANYYVDCSDSGSTNLGTYAEPFKDLSSISVSNGDGVYFKGGVTCTLNGGTNDKITIINSNTTWGCYDGDGDFSCENIVISTGANMPKFDGGDTYPGGDYEHFIRIHAQYVTVQDLWVTNMVAGDGIQANGNSQSGNNAVIQRCRVDDIWRQGISGNDCDNCTFTGNYISNVYLENGINCTDVSGVGLTCDYGCDGTVMSYNIVDGVYGEGIGHYWSNNSTDIIIEYNVVHNTRSAGIHGSEGEATIRYNIVGVHDANQDGYEPHFHGGTYPNCINPFKSGGIAVNATDAGSTGAVDSSWKIYGNFVHGTRAIGSALRAGIECSITAAARTQGDTIECLVYNNTLVDNEINIRLNKAGSAMSIDSHVKNNISVYYDGAFSGTATSDPSNDANGYFYDSGFGFVDDEFNSFTLFITSGSASGNSYTIDDTVAASNRLDCTGDNLYSDGVRSGDTYILGRHASESDPNNETAWDYNLWSSEPRVDVQGGNDPSYADADLVTKSGYVWPTTITAIDEEDFKILSDSPAVNVGYTLGSPYDSDFWGTSRPFGSAYDIGAYEYISGLGSGVINFNTSGSGKFNYNFSGSGKLSR